MKQCKLSKKAAKINWNQPLLRAEDCVPLVWEPRRQCFAQSRWGCCRGGAREPARWAPANSFWVDTWSGASWERNSWSWSWTSLWCRFWACGERMRPGWCARGGSQLLAQGPAFRPTFGSCWGGAWACLPSNGCTDRYAGLWPFCLGQKIKLSNYLDFLKLIFVKL